MNHLGRGLPLVRLQYTEAEANAPGQRSARAEWEANQLTLTFRRDRYWGGTSLS